jgi:Holliday junction resolvasome RuvABC endonuclease subunit
MNVLGIDLSINGTGLAMIVEDVAQLKLLSGGGVHALAFPRIEKRLASGDFYQGLLISPVPSDDMGRWQMILNAVMGYAMHCHQVTIEGYSFDSGTAWGTSLRELGGIIRYHLRKAGLTPLEVPPTQLKKFVTGDGHADKNIMIKECFKRWDVDFSDDNMADAFGLAKLGVAMARPGGMVGLPKFQYDVVQAILHPKVKPEKKRRGAA